MVAASHRCGCHQKLQVAYCQGGHLVRAAIGVMSHSIGEYSAVRLLQALSHHLEVLNVICLSWVDSPLPTSDQPHQFWTEHLCAHPRCHIAGRRACEINVSDSPAQGWERVASLRFAQRPNPTLHRFAQRPKPPLHRFAQPKAQDPNTIVELQVMLLRSALLQHHRPTWVGGLLSYREKTLGAIFVVGLGISWMTILVHTLIQQRRRATWLGCLPPHEDQI